MKKILRKFLSPAAQVKLREYKNWLKPFEPELNLIKYLCESDRIAIDIGAHIGLYSSRIRHYAKECILFEPNRSLAEYLRQSFLQKATIHEIALSNRVGVSSIRIPMRKGQHDDGVATIEQKNLLHDIESFEEYDVQCKTLDSFHFNNVGFIKIDVEGHELSVLQGGKETIIQNSPNILIEIEERHNPGAIKNVFELLSEFGFKGFFLVHGKLKSLDQFSLKIHQDLRNIQGNKKTGLYVNNFIFLRNPDLIERLIQRYSE